MSKKVYYVPDMAAAIGKTDSAVRAQLRRQNWPDAIPAPIKIGSQWAWRVEDVEAWLANKIAAVKSVEPTPTRRPVGRPGKVKSQG